MSLSTDGVSRQIVLFYHFLIAFFLHHAIMISINDRVDVIPHSRPLQFKMAQRFSVRSLYRANKLIWKANFYKAKIKTKVTRCLLQVLINGYLA